MRRSLPVFVRALCGFMVLLLFAVSVINGQRAAATANPRAPGDLDLSFGNGGIVTTPMTVTAAAASHAMIVQPDGKRVLVGSTFTAENGVDFALARFNPDGSLDAGFGTAGRTVTDFSRLDDTAYAVGIQSDGKIVVAGVTGYPSTDSFALARYLPNGNLDPTFGTGGRVTTASRDCLLKALIIQPDGKIVIGGYGGGYGTPNVNLIRYLSSGALDPTFGNGGQVATLFSGNTFVVRGLVLQPNGALLAAGSTLNSSQNNTDFALARYLGNGSLDPTFGSGGQVTTDFGQNESAQALTLIGGGNIVVAGYTQPYNGRGSFALARYTPNGTLDGTFGSGGRVTTGFGTADAFATSLIVQADGKAVVAGSQHAISNPNTCSACSIELARYGTNGSLDPTFGSGGRVTTLFGQNESLQAEALIGQTDGALVVAGIANIFPTDSFLQIRYLTNGSLDTNFAGDGHLRTPFYSSSARVNAGAAQADGKLVTVGYAATRCGPACDGHQFAVSRYLPSGALDSTFGSGGIVLTGFPNGPADAQAVAIQPDGKIVVGGAGTTDWPGPAVALARYLPDGTLDNSFGTGGRVLSNPDPASYKCMLMPLCFNRMAKSWSQVRRGRWDYSPHGICRTAAWTPLSAIRAL